MDIDTFIVERQVNTAFADSLRSLTEPDAAAVERLLRGLLPSANTLRRCLSIAEEIAARDKRELAEVLSEPRLVEELEREDAGRKQRQAKVFDVLEEMRYPVLQMLRKELETAGKEIRSAHGLHFEPPKDLEGDALQLRLSIRSLTEMEELGKRLQEAAGHPAASRMFAVLRGEF